MKRILPAYPLFVKDPYFSFWSNGEELNKSDVMLWTGEKKDIVGVIEIDGLGFAFLGNPPGVPTIKQTALNVTAYTTDYKFENDKLVLDISFVSPLTLDDMTTLSCPVCYLKYNITKKKDCETRVILALNGDVCYNHASPDQRALRGGTMKTENYDIAWFGLKRQAPLSHSGDAVGADWGYYYVTGETVGYERFPIHSLNSVGGRCENWIKSENSALSGNIMVGFDDVVSIAYFGDWQRGYYFDGGKTIIDALAETYSKIAEIDEKLAKEDKKLKKVCKKYGKEYLNILYASLRQSIAAHKLIKDRDGNVIFLSKECCSNGCIGTVDVSYPSIPLYLLTDTEYVKGMMRPVFKFARMPVWEYDFAPHDVGTYPICGGQVYGLNRNRSYLKGGFPETHPDIYLFPAGGDVFDYNMQMPVEECANMIVMAYACYTRDKDLEFVRENYDLLSKWVKYLTEFGLKPENQLCTDDFAGHLANNVNLAIKATVGIGCFAELARAMGESGDEYRAIAESFAREIEDFGKKYSHIPITWDSDDSTFSLKYNMLFDKVLCLGLFTRETVEREIDCYLERIEKCGVPLDSRSDRAKSDWIIWTAALSDDTEKISKLLHGITVFMTETSDRMPFGDYYFCKEGLRRNFTNRTVQGGCFALLLNDFPA